MELNLGLDEVVAVLRSSGAPGAAAARDVRGEGSSVTAMVDIGKIPGIPGALAAMARFAPPADVRIDDEGVAGRTWTLALRVSHPGLALMGPGFVTVTAREILANLPAGVAVARQDGGRTLVEVDLDAVTALVPAPPGVRPYVERVELGEQVRLVATLR